MTAEIIRFPGHHWHGCDNERCTVCEGGLALCTVCGGAEGSLTTDCPGERMPELIADEVHAARLDFMMETGWVQGPSAVWRRG